MGVVLSILRGISALFYTIIGVKKGVDIARDNPAELYHQAQKQKVGKQITFSVDEVSKQLEADEPASKSKISKSVFTPVVGFFKKAINFCTSDPVLRVATIAISALGIFMGPFGFAVGLAFFLITTAALVGQYIVEGQRQSNLNKIRNEDKVLGKIAKLEKQKQREIIKYPELQALSKYVGESAFTIDPKTLNATLKDISTSKQPILGAKDIPQHSGEKGITNTIDNIAFKGLENTTTLLSILSAASSIGAGLGGGLAYMLLIPPALSLAGDLGITSQERRAYKDQYIDLLNDIEKNKVLLGLEYTTSKGLDYLNVARYTREMELKAMRDVGKGMDTIRHEAAEYCVTHIQDLTTAQKKATQDFVEYKTNSNSEIRLLNMEVQNIQNAVEIRKKINDLSYATLVEKSYEDKKELQSKKSELRELIKRFKDILPPEQHQCNLGELEAQLGQKKQEVVEKREMLQEKQKRVLQIVKPEKLEQVEKEYEKTAENMTLIRFKERLSEYAGTQPLEKDQVLAALAKSHPEEAKKMYNTGVMANVRDLATTFSSSGLIEKSSPLYEHKEYKQTMSDLGLDVAAMRKEIQQVRTDYENLPPPPEIPPLKQETRQQQNFVDRVMIKSENQKHGIDARN